MRLVPASLVLEFELDDDKNEQFFNEFNSMTRSEEDALGAWLKRAKARGDTKESDQVLLTLLIELHRKFDELSEIIKNEQKSRIELKSVAKINGIGFDGISIDEPKFQSGKSYYERILMPIFPKRTIAIYLTGVDEKTAKISTMHTDDESDFNAYVTARERVMIRQNRD
ncbi:hypothetical protein CR66_07805 [Campylobacter mucosalis]|uniref:hypothetical protein n=1 Tax=Campylobacter mucosalis TaxID=202 RepID=UPI0004D43EB5|nr:hypothetical protein [Campylobacter mucosalis]KEA45412.1 hypothetical protein CR66_07805 [Campylobacter mucosalis]QKF63809.1 hypothetical protein CMCT_1709 [Campylobacter mucosalis]